MNASIQRRRLACAECTRKKIKCDKVIPCRNCSRRGHACYRVPQQTSNSHAAPIPASQGIGAPRAGVLEDNLNTCIQELQATLRAVRQSSSVPLPPSPGPPAVLPEPVVAEADTPPASYCPSKDSAEVEDAATILEFLAWGRRKVPAYDGSQPPSDSGPEESPGDVAMGQNLGHNESPHLRLTDESSSLPVLQLLLPEPVSLEQIVNYHCKCLLWYHVSFHSLTFRKEVVEFSDQHKGNIVAANVDLQWVALLFAVMAGSMTCAPPAIAQSWGFLQQERDTIARRWFKAALVCLKLADYDSNHSIYAVECIGTMTISAHMLGHSNSHSVMLAAAVRIAQSLGLHMIGPETLNSSQIIVRKEIGRRVWSELCIQDWFSIPFSESYLIHPLCFTTPLPSNCRDGEMIPLPDEIPTSMSYHRLLYQIARLMPRLQDDLTQSKTLYTKYEYVLQYDTQMRTLASKQVPFWLKNAPLDPSWPCYVPWARHCLTISSAHKIIMIHRKFLWPSFTNPAFSFTRKTCIAASKTIIRECKLVAEEDGPILWIYHAFAVAASIILCLDLLFRSPSDSQHEGQRDLIQDTVTILQRSQTSMIAKRGVTILRLLKEVEQSRRSSDAFDRTLPSNERQYALDIRKLVRAVCAQEASGQTLPEPDNPPQPIGSGGLDHRPNMPVTSFTDLEEHDEHAANPFETYLGPQSRFDMHDSLENILFLAQNCGRYS
ncbi:hypothetical protein BJY04DRAFT_218543 [Aspergillus karnatakaensis]|uniref:Zn(II)2Cys6 transcription factor n=1 Tax=Aspergillus karnatakaensis TaxID=1810916 RepID=UPI003CCD842D